MPKTKDLNTKNEIETDEDKIKRLVVNGLKGEMDEINSLDDRVIRGKINRNCKRKENQNSMEKEQKLF